MSDRATALRVARRFLAGNVGEFELPPDHLFGMRVPKEGAACSKCKYVSDDGLRCGNKYFHAWQESMQVREPDLLPAPADEYCCDVFRTTKGP